MRHLFACPTQAPVSDGENPGKIISEGKHGLGFSGYFLKLFFSSILFLLLGAQKGLAQFDLWADGVSSTTPAWDNSLNANQSDYFQGEVIPFVLKMGNLVNGTSYSFRIEYDYYHNGSGRNAGGMAYLTTYNLSRTPPVFTTGTTPVADNSFTGTGNVGIFYTVNADVTAATNPTVFSNNGTEVVKSVTVTFTYTGSNGGAADIYWGMYLAKTGTVTDFGTAPTNGASLWPGGSLQVTASPIQNLGTSSLGNVSINPSGGAVVEGIISGMKFSDLNNNGSLDNGEPGLQGWTIYIDNDGSGTLNTGDIVATTDASGNYSFNDLLPRPSAYIVREVNQAGWAQTLPGAGASYQYSFIITAADPTHTGIFGNFTCSPPAVSFTGTLADQCSSNTTYTLTGGSPGGGTYSGDGVTGTNFNASIAGVGSHTITYSYTDANGCTNTATNSINVTADASPGTVTGTPSTICIGGTTTYSSDGTTGGAWSSDNTGVATVNSGTGVITGVAAGTATITYTVTGCNGPNTAQKTVTVSPNPSAGTVSGTPSTICIGGTTTYSSDGTTGGAWSSDNTGVATINSGTGVITGVAAGTATITYTVTGCNGPYTAQKTVTVSPNPSAGTVSGTPSTICIGGTTTYSSDGTSGGTWSSDNTGVATVNSGTGVITGVTAGTATITYTVTGCNGPYTAQKMVTVSPNPSAGTVSGFPSTICISGTTTYSSDGTTGGAWSSDNTGVATVNSGTGVITGVSAGTATITYTVTGCNGPYTAQKTVTVSPNPSAGTVSGSPSTICIGGTTTYSSDGTTGGAWSSDNTGVATVNSGTGVITGVAAGTATITYTVTGCNGPYTAQKTVTVSPNPSAGTVSGTPSTICIGGTTTYSSDGTSGGTWSSDNTGVATVNSLTGVITGVAAGTATITYTVTGCNGPYTAQKTVTVSPNPSAGAVSGTPSTICIGGTTTYSSDGTTGGSWSSDNTGVATVNSGTGVITGVAAGTATITYTVTGCNGPYTAQKTVTVSPNPSAGTVSGTPSAICIGGTTTYSSDGTSGGTWSSDNTGVATVNSGTGVITGVSAGTATITYTVTGCNGPYTAQKTVTVSPNPSAGTVTGTPSTICIGGTTTYSSDGTTGGSWTSDNTGIATVNSGTGVITGVAAGTATITYTVTGCNGPYTAQKMVTVSPNPSAGTVSGTPSTICIGGTTTYSSDGTTGGAWTSGSPGIASVNSGTGVITGMSAGTATITYTVNGCNGPYTASKTVTVSPNSLCAAYNGVYFANTGSTSTGGSATVNLVFNISADASASCKDISGLNAGSFTITPDQPGAVNFGAKSYTGGVLTVPVTINIPANQYSITVQFNLGIVGSNYVLNAGCTDVPLVTVSSNSNDFVTGGGFIIPTNSYSKKAGSNANGLKNNFGFNVKWNKSLTNLQGNFNTIIRRMENNGVHLYQVKSSKPGTLVVTKLTANGYTNSYRADITFSAANIQDLTLGLATGEGPGTVYLTVIDNGEPGSNGSTTDQVLITIKDKSNVLWYTSDVTANTTVGNTANSANIPLLNRGNIQVHTSGGVKTVTMASGQVLTEVQKFELRALPNPSPSSFNLLITTDNNIEKMSVRVMDIMGRTVQTFNNLVKSQTLNIGAGFTPGVYMVELIQGNKRQQVKLVKLW